MARQIWGRQQSFAEMRGGGIISSSEVRTNPFYTGVIYRVGHEAVGHEDADGPLGESKKSEVAPELSATAFHEGIVALIEADEPAEVS